jgi:lycopene cyclase domain-containing protein
VSYTAVAVLMVLLTIGLDLLVLRTRLLTSRAFWVAYAIVLGFQLLVNGVLTGQEVVRYDEDAILGLRVVWAPVEDLLFGFALVVQTLAWWTWWGRRLSAQRAS